MFWLHYVLQGLVFGFVLVHVVIYVMGWVKVGLVSVVLDRVLTAMLSTIFSGCGCQQGLLLLVLEFCLCLFSGRNSATLMLHVFLIIVALEFFFS